MMLYKRVLKGVSRVYRIEQDIGLDVALGTEDQVFGLVKFALENKQRARRNVVRTLRLVGRFNLANYLEKKAGEIIDEIDSYRARYEL